MSDDQIEDRIRATARAALAQYERAVDVEAGLATVKQGVEVASQQSRPPERRWIAYVAAATIIVVGFGLALAWNPLSESVITDSPSTASTESIAPNTLVTDPTEPLTSTPATTQPTATTNSVGVVEPSQTTTPAAPPADLFESATSVASGPSGIWLGVEAADGTEWFPTAYTKVATGPAMLAGSYVVTQPSDAILFNTTAGPISIITADGVTEWQPRDTSPEVRYTLLDAGVVDGLMVMLVSEARYDMPETSFDHLLMVDLSDDTVVDLGNMGGWESGIRAGGIGGSDIKLLLSSGASNSLAHVGFDGERLGQSDLASDTNWSLSVTSDRAFAHGLRYDDDEPGVPKLEILARPGNDNSLIPLPAYDLIAYPCRFPSYDGVNYRCATDGEPVEFNIVTGSWTQTAAPTGSIVTVRRGTASAVPTVSTDVFRPYVDPAICEPVRAQEGALVDSILSPFGQGSEAFLAYQVFVDKQLGANGRFAFVGRLASDPRPFVSNGDFETSNGRTGTVYTSPLGTGQASVRFPDGTNGYVRSFGFDQTAIEQLVEALEPRTPAAAVPGFDLAPNGIGSTLRLEVDEPNRPVNVEYAVLSCGTSATYRVGAVTGDPLGQYLFALDQANPTAVGSVNDALVTIAGGLPEPDAPGRPTLTDVAEAPADVWVDLLLQPRPGFPVEEQERQTSQPPPTSAAPSSSG
jgi:hypothetical protein